jgi:hypothetical protein
MTSDLQLPDLLTGCHLSPRYMITSLDRTHAGFYRCIVRNRMGALLQRQTEVQVACEYNGELGAEPNPIWPSNPLQTSGGPSRLSRPVPSF